MGCSECYSHPNKVVSIIFIINNYLFNKVQIKGGTDIIVSNINEYHISDLGKSNTPNKSYIINNKVNELNFDNETFSNKCEYNFQKAKSFSINKNRINKLALKYNILNYDISYRSETFRVIISNITENKIKKICNNLKFTRINKISKKPSSSITEKENQIIIENNYYDKYNTLKSYLI